jgi:hypothetical protein
MKKDWIEDGDAAFLTQVEQFLTALDTTEGRAATGLSAASLAELRVHKTELSTALAARTAHEAAWRESVRDAGTWRDTVEDKLRPLARVAQNALGMTDGLRTAAGLPLRGVASAGTPAIPIVTDLMALTSTSGKNFLDWSGPTGAGIQYLVYGKKAGQTEFSLLDAVTSTEYSHLGAGVGVHWTYYILPKRRGQSGDPSNQASVYA